MRCGMTLYIQNHDDWNRYEAAEKGLDALPLDPGADNKRYMEEIDSALLIEDLGFDSLWTVEHHISPYTMVTNPLQLLTYFAGATKKLDLGTMVVVLPWHHPIRVAEDMTTLQSLMRGRTPFIGFGRGAAKREFEQLGFDMNESKDRFSESVDVIRLALTEESFSYEGELLQFEGVTMRPRPRDPQALIDAMHFSWGSQTSAPVGARHGLKPLLIPQKAWSEYTTDLSLFSAARAEIGLPPVRPRIHMLVYVADTEEQAREGARRYIPQYSESALRNYQLLGDHFAKTKGYEHYAAQAATVTDADQRAKEMGETYLANHVWGTPDQCIERLRAIADSFHPEEFMLAFRYGAMPEEDANRSLQLFASEVLPAIKEIPLLEPIDYTTAGARV